MKHPPAPFPELRLGRILGAALAAPAVVLASWVLYLRTGEPVWMIGLTLAASVLGGVAAIAQAEADDLRRELRRLELNEELAAARRSGRLVDAASADAA